ncbi:HAD family hydrolase [Neisseria bacilliformis]|jgi:hypothetical protein|uniref:HAD family hydrolase n=1 Tax=Neisseria bacilliformis TaxID=267212 RepID=UPI0006696F60|nr:HAD family hydrolase [Neisseria bacilliformis]
MNRKPQTVFVDVDDTLIRSAGCVRIPIPAAAEAVRRLSEQGAVLYLWSSGGADYAREAARFLGLEHCFAAFLPKPDAYIDDMAVGEWRFCRHVLPQNALYLCDEA